MAEYKKHVTFKGKILIVGFGAVGQGTLPLILRHIDMPREKVKIITAEDSGREIAQEYGISFTVEPLVRENYLAVLDRELEAGDFLFNASFDVSSLALIEYCSEHGILYLDACIEPWAGGHRDTSVPAARRTNYAFRELAKEIGKRYPQGPTCVTMHGANPGLVSHLLKQALLNIASDTGAGLPEPKVEGAVGALRHAARHQDGADRGAGPPGRQPPQRVGRVRQHLVERGVRRRIPAARRAGLGHPRAALAARGHGVRLRLRLLHLSQPPGLHDAGALLGPHRGSVPRLADLARRIAFDPRLLHRLGQRPRHLSPDRLLCLPPLRRRGAVPARDGGSQLHHAGEAPACCGRRSSTGSTSWAFC